MQSRFAVGVDLGGSKIEAVVLRRDEDPSTPGFLHAKARIPTPQADGFDAVVRATADLVHAVVRDAGLSHAPPIGVGMPGGTTFRAADGSRSPEPLVKNSNATCLNGRPFQRALAEALGISPLDEGALAFGNDANCFALGEAAFGAARGARVAFGVILGTGVGGGIAIRGEDGVPRAWEGAQGIAGEWGHVPLDPVSGPPCYCGRRGCIERYLSGPAIEAAYEAASGHRADVPEIAQRSRAHEPEARALLTSTMATFGRALALVIDVLDPDVVVLGGGVSNLEAFYDEGRHEVARWVFNDELTTRIVKHELGDAAGVYGAAMLPRPA